jgi:XTP/dITP diphosphohydrolase
VGGIPEVEETGATFTENAVLKACTVAAAAGHVAFADDSGLEVLALNGEPGIQSARYAGPGASDGDKMAKLLARLGDATDRRARFVCVLAVATPAGLIGTVEGEVRGHITRAPRGTGGFGYYPLFVPEGYHRTLGELEPSVKARISHRANAVAAAVQAGLFGGQEETPGGDRRRDA